MNGPAFRIGVNRNIILARRSRNVHTRIELSLKVEEFDWWGHPHSCRNTKIGSQTMQVFHRWAELVVA